MNTNQNELSPPKTMHTKLNDTDIQLKAVKLVADPKIILASSKNKGQADDD